MSRPLREMMSDIDGPGPDDLIPDPPGDPDPDIDAVFFELFAREYDPDDPRNDDPF